MGEHRVVGVVLRHRDRILLCHRSPQRAWFPDVWDFPGGHVRPGEEPEEALRREVHEELGIELQGLDGPPLLHQVDTGTGLDLTLWVSTAWRGTPANRSPEEHDTIGWFARHQLDELRWADPAYRGLLQELLAGA